MAVSKVVLGDETLIDLTSDTVSEDTLLEGATAHAANGEQITGGVVVTPMYTGTKAAIEEAIALGQIPEDAVVNITDDEETSSFQTQINEINSSLAWNEMDISITPPNTNTPTIIATIEEIIGKNEVIFQTDVWQIHIYNLNKDNYNSSMCYFPGGKITGDDFAKFIQFYVNFSTGEIKARQYKGTSTSNVTFTKLFYR